MSGLVIRSCFCPGGGGSGRDQLDFEWGQSRRNQLAAMTQAMEMLPIDDIALATVKNATTTPSPTNGYLTAAPAFQSGTTAMPASKFSSAMPILQLATSLTNYSTPSPFYTPHRHMCPTPSSFITPWRPRHCHWCILSRPHTPTPSRRCMPRPPTITIFPCHRWWCPHPPDRRPWCRHRRH